MPLAGGRFELGAGGRGPVRGVADGDGLALELARGVAFAAGVGEAVTVGEGVVLGLGLGVGVDALILVFRFVLKL